jgi:hypothetical protein
MPNRKFNKQVKNEFLKRLVEHGGSESRALQYINYTPQALYQYLRRGLNDIETGNSESPSSEFYRKYQQARVLGKRILTDEAIRRAYEGVSKNIYHQGMIIGTEIQYSDMLLKELIFEKRKGTQSGPNHEEQLPQVDDIVIEKISSEMSEKDAAQLYAQTIKGIE